MHITGTLISGAVSAVTGTGSGGALLHSAFTKNSEDKNPKLISYAGAFVFAAQMINFTIPLTDSSGHFAGGFLLACLLGGRTSYMIMSVILTVQALFFGDGGLIALGCNIFNMGLIPCLIIYPLISRFLKHSSSSFKENTTLIIGGWISVMAGASAVVVETFLSGVSEIQITSFAANMLSVHAVIGIAEGLITVVIITAVKRLKTVNYQKIFLGVVSIFTAGILSLYASTYPDGLEWSLEKIGYSASMGADIFHVFFDEIQSVTAVFHEYQSIFDSAYFSFAGFAGIVIIFILTFGIEKLKYREV